MLGVFTYYMTRVTKEHAHTPFKLPVLGFDFFETTGRGNKRSGRTRPRNALDASFTMEDTLIVSRSRSSFQSLILGKIDAKNTVKKLEGVRVIPPAPQLHTNILCGRIYIQI